MKKKGIDAECKQLTWVDPTLCVHNSLKELKEIMNVFYCHRVIVMLSLSLGARTTDFKLRLKSFQPNKFHITVCCDSLTKRN